VGWPGEMRAEEAAAGRTPLTAPGEKAVTVKLWPATTSCVPVRVFRQRFAVFEMFTNPRRTVERPVLKRRRWQARARRPAGAAGPLARGRGAQVVALRAAAQ